MAFNPQEQSIIQWGLQNGKTKEDVSKAIGNFRAGITPPKPEVQRQQEQSTYQQNQSPILGAAKESLSGLGELYGGGEHGIANKLKQDVQAGAADIQKGGVGNFVKGVAKAGLRTAGDVAGAVYAPVGAVVGTALKATGAQDAIDWVGNQIAEKNGITDNKAFQDWAMKHPNAAEDFQRALNLTLASQDAGKIEPSTMLERTKAQLTPASPKVEIPELVPNKSDVLHNQNVDSAVQIRNGELMDMGDKVQTQETLNRLGVPEKVKVRMEPVYQNSSPVEESSAIQAARESKAAGLQSLKEKISPKPTAKEAKLAMQQGRITAPTEPGLFTRGEPTKVSTPDQQFKSIQTIDRLIPEHPNLTEPELYSELKTKIGESAEQLKPDMKAIQIDKNITGKAFKDWKNIKSSQADSAEFVDNLAGNKKLQSQFESRLKNLEWDITDKSGKFKAPTPKTLDDVWQTAIEYDNSVPDNIKNATSMSDAKLQFRKEMWLENRALLRNILTDVSSGLGEKAKQAFSDMTDMYEAQRGIISKAKIQTKGAPSKASTFIKNNPIIKAGIKATGLGAGLHLLP